jgi:hypothetical protein
VVGGGGLEERLRFSKKEGRKAVWMKKHSSLSN